MVLLSRTGLDLQDWGEMATAQDDAAVASCKANNLLIAPLPSLSSRIDGT